VNLEIAQKNQLTEILNNGVEKAAATLSTLLGNQVQLDIPDYEIYNAREIDQKLKLNAHEKIVSVTQGFSGKLSGDALMVMSNFSAIILTHRLTQGLGEVEDINSEKQSALTEVGNIVINSLVGAWSEAFENRFEFEVPKYQEGTLDTVLRNYDVGPGKQSSGDAYAMSARANFNVHDFFLVLDIILLFDKTAFESQFGVPGKKENVA